MREIDPLWVKLKRFDLEQLGGSYTYADRLAAENGWSKGFTLRVIDEYRRFLYLAARAGHKVTPSTVIDEAWHLHLLYTESYWDDLCATVLERPLHHGPTKGGAAEEEKFRDWYQRTLASYRETFGEEAPADIWPNGKGARNGHSKRYRLVDSARYFVLPRPTTGHLTRVVALGAVGAVFAGAAKRDASIVEIGDLVLLIVITLIVGLILHFTGPARKRRGDHESSGSCSGGCGGGIHTTSGHDYHTGADSDGSDGDGGDSGGDGGGDGGGGDGGSCGGGCGGGGD